MNSSQRLGVSIAVVLCAWSSTALATITMNPSTINAGSIAIGGTTSPAATGMISSTAMDRVDLVVDPMCPGPAGTFNLSPDNNLDLRGSAVVTVNVTYSPTAAGAKTCVVNVYDHGTSNSLGTFMVTGTGQRPPTVMVTQTGAYGAVRFNNAALIHTSLVIYTITNTGDQVLDVMSVTSDNTDFAITAAPASGLINPGNAKNWTVTFDPSAAGTRTGTLTITSNATNSPTPVAMSGIGQNATIGVTTDINFNTVLEGSSSSSLDTITNGGAAPKGNLGVSLATIAGGTWFTFSGCGGGRTCNTYQTISTTATMGISCTVPAGTGPGVMQTGSVTFTSDSDTANGNTTNLTCLSGASQVQAAQSSVPFGGQLVTTTSTQQVVTVNNTGNAGYTFWFDRSGPQASAFTATCATGCSAPGCGTSAANMCTLPGPGTMTFSSTFTPAGEGDYSATLVLRSAGASPSLTLSGRGIDKHILTDQFAQASDTFRNPGSKAAMVPVKVQNVGEYPLHITNLVVSGDPVWSLGEPSTDIMIDGLSSRDIIVLFSPVIAGKALTGQLTVVSDDLKTTPPIILLNGNGKDRNVAMSPTTLVIGDTGAGIPIKLSEVKPNELITLTNQDDADFTIREVRVSDGDPVFEARDLDGNKIDMDHQIPIKVGETVKLDIVFAPEKVGQFDARVRLFLDEDGDAQQTSVVQGRALFVDAHGSGGFGCSTGGGAGGGMVIVLGLLVRRRRRR